MDKTNIQVIKFDAYNPPKSVEKRNDAWVNFGEKNDYYQFLIDRYNNSTTNNQVINNITKLIYGKGLTATDASKKPNEYAQLMTVFAKDDVKKLVTDLYLLGQCAIQCIYDKGGKTIVEAKHVPAHLIRPEKCNEEGEIENYYYSDNWADIKNHKPEAFPAFGTTNKGIEILTIGNYTVGQKYFSNVAYLGGLAYAKLEEDISTYLINLLQSGFSPLTIVNFANGTPEQAEQKKIADSVLSKATGAAGVKTIISFSNGQENKTTIESVPVNDAAAQYQYLSDEARAKILLSHGVTSGLLFGIPSANGFSSNADELKTAFVLFDNNVIIPQQELFITGVDKILAFNGIALDLKFKALKTLDETTDAATDADSTRVVSAVNAMSPLVANKVLESMTPDEIRSLIGLGPTIGGGKLDTAPAQFSKHDSLDELDLEAFGEEIDSDEWELISSERVDYDREDELDSELDRLNTPQISSFTALKNKITAFVSAGNPKPNAKSEQDGVLYKSRYRYTGELSSNSRKFCKNMVARDKVYRKEDIVRMSDQVVNETRKRKDGTIGGFGPHGDTKYDVFFYKGGGACHHYWTRETYKRKDDVNSPNAKEVTPAEARKAGEILPTNDKKVYTRPIDMPNQGFLPK